MKIIFRSLYCDDKYKVDSSVYYITAEKNRITTHFINIDKDTLTTIGEINSNFQLMYFPEFCQPYYAIINSDIQNLVEPFRYNPSEKEFIAFLKNGIRKYKNIR